MRQKKTIKKPKLGFDNRGNLFRKVREEHGLTQMELSEQLGVHSQFCSNWERGLCSVPDHAVRRFAYSFGIPRDRFKMAMMQDYGAYVEEFTRWVYSK